MNRRDHRHLFTRYSSSPYLLTEYEEWVRECLFEIAAINRSLMNQSRFAFSSQNLEINRSIQNLEYFIAN